MRPKGSTSLAVSWSTYSGTNWGAFSDNPLEDNLVFAYFSQNSLILYRRWIADGKRMPEKELIAVATKLICGGLGAYVKGRQASPS